MSQLSPQVGVKSKPIWFTGVCDTLLRKIYIWDTNYDKGELYSTRDFLDHDGTIKKIPMKRSHKIPFTLPELQHLYLFLKADPDLIELAREVKALSEQVWPHGKLLTGGQRIVEVAFYHVHVRTMLETIKKVKDAPRIAALEKAVEEAKSGGKDLFEI